jgi:hypothetical protein
MPDKKPTITKNAIHIVDPRLYAWFSNWCKKTGRVREVVCTEAVRDTMNHYDPNHRFDPEWEQEKKDE